MGMVRYYQRFCPNLAEILQPLTNLLHKEAEINRNWGPDQEQAKQHVKNMLLSLQMLAHFNPSLKICLQTDALDIALHQQNPGQSPSKLFGH